MRGNRLLDWFFRLLFPVVLVGLLIYTFIEQPPPISSPEVKAGFAKSGSSRGYLEQVEPQTGPWPENLPPLLQKALTKSFGPSRPQVGSFYYFGTAKRRMWGFGVPVGYETVLIPGSGFSRQISLSAFNLHLALWQTGLKGDRSWLRENGKRGPAVREKAESTYLLEQAALLLPLAGGGFSFEQAGPGLVRARTGQGEIVELEFSGEQLVGVSAGPYQIKVEAWASFGDYHLPCKWAGGWGQAGLTEMEIQGLVLNPPFAREALDSAAGEGDKG